MNILFVSDYYPDKAQPQHCIYIQQQAQALVQLGHQVEVIVPSYTYSLNEKIEKEMMAGLPVYYSEYFTLYKRIYCTAALKRNIRKFEQYINFDQYEVLSFHMFDEFTLRIFTKIAKKHKIKMVVHYHGLSVLYNSQLPFKARIMQKRGDRVLKKLVSKANAIVGVSNKVCERVKTHYENKQIFTVYNGVDTVLFKPVNKAENNIFTIISVASLKKIKGNHYLIEAVKMLIERHGDRNIQLIIIGRGPEEDNLKALVENLNMESVVRFVGYIKYQEVARIMQNCDIYAMPSYYEALGCVYLEAMACKLPVIGCLYQGIGEIIIDGQNGLLIEPHNVKQLFEKMEYLLQNPEKAKEIALNGYNTVVNGFTWRDSARSLLEVYKKVCNCGET
ncbi:MAG: glycosyltransferase family 4 protein [Herbinix sp.]|nr:glycosyltransferase family 4 protein [Herbinix sp.]